MTEVVGSAGGRLRVAMVAYGDITHDSRVQKEASALAESGLRVTLFCLAGDSASMPGLSRSVRVIAWQPSASRVLPRTPSPFFAAPGRRSLWRTVDRAAWVAGYARNLRRWGRQILVRRSEFDVWHAHDFAALMAIGGGLPRSAALVYDVHDLFLDTGSGARLPRIVRFLVARYERWLIRRASAVITVNPALAGVLRRRYRPRSMLVIHNCPPRREPPARRPDLLRAATGAPAGAPVVLFHGALGHLRGIDTLCEAMLDPRLGDVHVVLMGYGVLRDSFVELAREPRFAGRLHVLEPVPPTELLDWVASADVGILARPAANLDLYLSTPNKLFECLAAGTPVVASDFPAVRDIVLGDELGPLGATCRPSDAQDLARAIESLVRLRPDEAEELRRRCATAAQLRWNWETEVTRLLALYAALARRTGRPGEGLAPVAGPAPGRGEVPPAPGRGDVPPAPAVDRA